MGICHAPDFRGTPAPAGSTAPTRWARASSNSASAARAQRWPVHDIGFSYPVDESFFVAEIDALRAEATELGARLHVHTAKENRDNQSRQIH